MLGNVDGEKQGQSVRVVAGHSVLRTLISVVCAKPTVET